MALPKTSQAFSIGFLLVILASFAFCSTASCFYLVFDKQRCLLWTQKSVQLLFNNLDAINTVSRAYGSLRIKHTTAQSKWGAGRKPVKNQLIPFAAATAIK